MAVCAHVREGQQGAVGSREQQQQQRWRLAEAGAISRKDDGGAISPRQLFCSELISINTVAAIGTQCLVALFAGYIGEFEYIDDHRAGKIVVELNGRCVVPSRRDGGGKNGGSGWW